MRALPALLHELGTVGVGRDRSRWELPLVVALAGVTYGAFMGSFTVYSFERSLALLYVALKVPLLIFATSLICLPGFFTLNAVLGLQGDFARALRAIAAAQAALTLALASLGPLTSVFYLSGITHDGALMLNALMFLLATLAGQSVMRRSYAGLIAHPERGPRHRLMLWVWTLLYAFVGMQMGWMLRPFVGSHELPVTFFRAEPFSNAYVAIIALFF